MADPLGVEVFVYELTPRQREIMADRVVANAEVRIAGHFQQSLKVLKFIEDEGTEEEREVLEVTGFPGESQGVLWKTARRSVGRGQVRPSMPSLRIDNHLRNLITDAVIEKYRSGVLDEVTTVPVLVNGHWEKRTRPVEQQAPMQRFSSMVTAGTPAF